MDENGNENTTGYIVSMGESYEDINISLYKLNQLPTNWINKGFRLKRDALTFFEICEKDREFIIQCLEEIEFPFDRFYRDHLKSEVYGILEKNINRQIPTYDTFYLLMHLSLENFLKGLWLDQNRDRIGFEKIPDEIKTHNLLALFQKIGIGLSKKEGALIKKISDLFVGYSRYPVKLFIKPEKEGKTLDIDFGERNFDSICIDCLENPYAEDHQIILDLFDKKLKPLLERAMESHNEHITKVLSPEYF